MAEPVSEEMLNIPLERISLNPLQPRKHFDESKIIELSKSIQNQGVINPWWFGSIRNFPVTTNSLQGNVGYVLSRCWIIRKSLF